MIKFTSFVYKGGGGGGVPRVVELNIPVVFSATLAGCSPYAADKQGSGPAVCGW